MTLEVGQSYPVTVLKLIRTGILVQLGDNPSDTAMIHLSLISRQFVNDVSKFVSVGSQYTAKAIVGKIKPIELSLLDMNLKAVSGTPIKQSQIHTKPSLDDMLKRAETDLQDKLHSQSKRRSRKGFN